MEVGEEAEEEEEGKEAELEMEEVANSASRSSSHVSSLWTGKINTVENRSNELQGTNKIFCYRQFSL